MTSRDGNRPEHLIAGGVEHGHAVVAEMADVGFGRGAGIVSRIERTRGIGSGDEVDKTIGVTSSGGTCLITFPESGTPSGSTSVSIHADGILTACCAPPQDDGLKVGKQTDPQAMMCSARLVGYWTTTVPRMNG
jgi:hypothetical protein